MTATLADGTRTGSPFVPPVPASIFSPDCGDVTFYPSGDTRTVYVDSVDGNDGWDGLFPDHSHRGAHGPKKTIPAAYRIMRNGFPDWMLLKRGCTWSGTNLERSSGQVWTKSGLSAAAPMLIGPYGDERLADPILDGDGVNVPLPLNIIGTSVATTRIAGRTRIGFTPPSSSTIGWTLFTLRPSSAARVIYVSTSGGNDANPGTSEALPKRTISAGYTLLANGEGDWLLLKRGDIWDAMDEMFPNWQKSGFSSAYPMLISTYGTGVRPIIDVPPGQRGFRSNTTISNVAIVGLDFYESGHNNSSSRTDGVEMTQFSSNILFEDCRFRNFGNDGGNGMTISAGSVTGMTNITIRRCVVCDTWVDDGSSGGNGIYTFGIVNLLIEECVVTNNGATAAHPINGYYGHNLYLHNGGENTVVLRGNIIAETDGAQVRAGGAVNNNLFLKNAIALHLGAGWDTYFPGGVLGSAFGNVFIDGSDTYQGGSGALQRRGTGIVTQNFRGGDVSYNIIAMQTTGTDTKSMVLSARDSNFPNSRGTINANVHHNIIYKWGNSDLGGGWTGNGPRFGMIDGDGSGANRFNDNVVVARTTEKVMHHDSSATYTTSYLLEMNRNRFYRTNANGGEATAFQTGSGNVNLATYAARFGGVLNTWGAPSYPNNPDARTAGTYHQIIGSVHGIPADGTVTTFLLDARQQTRFGPGGQEYYATDMLPLYTLNNIAAGPQSNYPGGVSTLGPNQYFRDGFSMTGYPGP